MKKLLLLLCLLLPLSLPSHAQISGTVGAQADLSPFPFTCTNQTVSHDSTILMGTGTDENQLPAFVVDDAANAWYAIKRINSDPNDQRVDKGTLNPLARTQIGPSLGPEVQTFPIGIFVRNSNSIVVVGNINLNQGNPNCANTRCDLLIELNSDLVQQQIVNNTRLSFIGMQDSDYDPTTDDFYFSEATNTGTNLEIRQFDLSANLDFASLGGVPNSSARGMSLDTTADIGYIPDGNVAGRICRYRINTPAFNLSPTCLTTSITIVPNSIEVVNSRGVGYTSGNGRLVRFDLSTFTELNFITYNGSSSYNAIVYDNATNRVFVAAFSGQQVQLHAFDGTTLVNQSSVLSPAMGFIASNNITRQRTHLAFQNRKLFVAGGLDGTTQNFIQSWTVCQ